LPIPAITSDSEIEIYSKLIKGSLIPRYMFAGSQRVSDAGAGNYLKTHAPGFTARASWGPAELSPHEYAGVLRDSQNSTLTLVFRPSIEF
jgi:hypothetical protein